MSTHQFVEIFDQALLVGGHFDFFDRDLGAVFRLEVLERRFELDTGLASVGLGAGELGCAFDIFMLLPFEWARAPR